MLLAVFVFFFARGAMTGLGAKPALTDVPRGFNRKLIRPLALIPGRVTDVRAFGWVLDVLG